MRFTHRRLPSLFARVIIVVFSMLLWLPFNAGAEMGWQVRSVYKGIMPGQKTRTVYWRFILDSSKVRGPRVLRVFDDVGQVGNGAELYFDLTGRVERVFIWRMVRGRKIISKKTYSPEVPIVNQDCLAPISWPNCPLPYSSNGDPRDFTLRNRLGGATFVSKLRLVERSVTYEEAVKKGMIDDSNHESAAGKKLYLVEVYKLLDKQSSLVFRQLWAAGDLFWIYEEQGDRYSWREN